MVGVRNPCAEAVLKLYLIANIGDRSRLAVLPRKAAEFGSEPSVRPFMVIFCEPFDLVWATE